MLYLHSATTFGTSGIYRIGATTMADLRNNLIVNNSTAGPTGGFSVALRCSTVYNSAFYASTSNNNCFFAGTPSAKNLIFYDGTNSDQTVGAYKSRVTGRDGLSLSESPNFVTVDGNPYRINTTIATQLESGALPVTSPIAITDDYFANIRNTNSPDIGAEEFSGVMLDLTSPAIAYTDLGVTNLTAERTLTATISDANGVPASGAGLPVLYWKINSGSYIPVTGVSIGNNQYTFKLGAGVVVNDTVRYYIVAQDLIATPNVGSYPSGASGFTANPPVASTPPPAPSFYAIVAAPLAGDYTVGDYIV